MRTLLASPELFLADGGIARIMRLYLKALCESAAPGDEVDGLVLNDHPETDPRLARYSSPALASMTGCDRRRARFVRHAFRLGRRADRAVCGHVHLLPTLWLAQRFNSRLTYSLVAHGIEVWRPFSGFERRALRGARRILCVSEFTQRQLLRFCPELDPTRFRVIPNAFDPFFQLSSAGAGVPRSGNGPTILTVSRLSTVDTYKGVDTLIEALPLVRKSCLGARLRVVGGGEDQARLRGVAVAQGVVDAVEFTGAIGDEALRLEYAGCDLFALPSQREGFGLVYLEAMSFGKPCVGARAGGVPEVVNDRVGALAEYGNIPDIAAAVIDLVRHPRDADVIRQHAARFDFAAFRQRLPAALA